MVGGREVPLLDPRPGHLAALLALQFRGEPVNLRLMPADALGQQVNRPRMGLGAQLRLHQAIQVPPRPGQVLTQPRDPSDPQRACPQPSLPCNRTGPSATSSARSSPGLSATATPSSRPPPPMSVAAGNCEGFTTN
jgi:hypothetical protein